MPTYALSALCGWSFGFAVGLPAMLGGFTLAATVGYALARTIDRGRAMAVVDGSSRLKNVHRALATGGIATVALVVAPVRLAPAAPFSLTNLVMAAVQISAPAYIAGTLLGMVPRTAVLVYAASRLSDLGKPPSQEPWLWAAGAVLTAAVVAALGWIGKRGLAHVTSADSDTARTTKRVAPTPPAA